MEIPRSMLDGLTAEINALSEAGQRMVLEAVSNSERATVAELREVASKVMQSVCGSVAGMAAARSAAMYDAVREMAVGSGIGATVDAGYEPDATDGAVRALVSSVAKTGSTERFARDLAARVDYEVKKAAGECMFANGRRDDLDVRFARVPSGGETCPFCVMLASRGFVYRGERAAGALRHYHANCDCRIVPCFDSRYAGPSRRFSASTTVEGYDLDGLYRRYVQDLEDGRLSIEGVRKHSSHVHGWDSKRFASYGDFAEFVEGARDIEDLQVRCAAVEREWGRTGLSDRYLSQLRQAVLNKRSSLMHDAFYEKPRAALEEHERRGIDHLLENGIVPTVKREDPLAKANIDIEIDGQLWEMKNVTNNRSSVSNQLSRGRKKWFKLGIDEPARIVVTCEECDDSFESVCESIASRLWPGEKCIALSQSGEMRMIP